jgi:hypothetical protein
MNIKKELEKQKKKVFKLKASILLLEYSLLDLKAKTEHNCHFDFLTDKEKRAIALMVAREQYEKENI